LLVSIPFFIPVYQQKTITVKSSFLNVFSLLLNPEKWERWRKDLHNDILADSSKIAIHKDAGAFSISYALLNLKVQLKENTFNVDERLDGKSSSYNYGVIPVPDKLPPRTVVTANKQVCIAHWVLQSIWPISFADTHIDELKNYFETDSLLYGFKIFKTGVPESFLIVSNKQVLKKDEFTEAASLLDKLQTYIKTHNIKKLQPLIAQFRPIVKDTVEVKVGFFVDKEVKSDNLVTFNRMPKGGPLYAARFYGDFNKRQAVYNALHQYYADHLYQSAILPFEMYLDDKLPVSDTSKVKIQVNFSGFF